MISLAKTPQSVRNSARKARWNSRMRKNDLMALYFAICLSA
jgi:hypothetical protein